MQPDSTSTIGRRFTALALAFLFLLQSAAQAGSGCLPSVLRARCCCVIAERGDVGANASKSNAAAVVRHSCCAAKVRHAPEQGGPEVGVRSGCCCEQALVPSAPTDAGSSWARDGARDLHTANLVAHASIAVDYVSVRDVEFTASPPLSSPPGSPPRCAASSTTTRLAQRGVIGLLSDLGTFLE